MPRVFDMLRSVLMRFHTLSHDIATVVIKKDDCSELQVEGLEHRCTVG